MNQRHCSTSRSRNVSVSISVVITSCLLISASYPFLMQRAHASSLVDDKFRSGSNTRIGVSSLNLPQNLQTPTYRKGELLIRFRGGLSQIEKDTIMATRGARLKKQLRGESEIEKLELTGNDDAATAALQLSLNPSVEFVEPNFLIAKDQLDSTLPNDPRFPEQWALNNTGQNNGQHTVMTKPDG